MKTVKLDHAAKAVKEFVRNLPVDAGPVQVELDGRVVCTVLPSLAFSEKEKAALLREGQQLVHRARARCKEIPSRVIKTEVRKAVELVRRTRR